MEIKTVKLAIVGSRNFDNYGCLEKEILARFNLNEIESIVSGGATGADSLAADFSRKFNIPLLEFLPDWKKYGRAAGNVRNTRIVENSTCMIAFLKDESAGTRDSIKKATKKGMKVFVVIQNANTENEIKTKKEMKNILFNKYYIKDFFGKNRNSKFVADFIDAAYRGSTLGYENLLYLIIKDYIEKSGMRIGYRSAAFHLGDKIFYENIESNEKNSEKYSNESFYSSFHMLCHDFSFDEPECFDMDFLEPWGVIYFATERISEEFNYLGLMDAYCFALYGYIKDYIMDYEKENPLKIK